MIKVTNGKINKKSLYVFIYDHFNSKIINVDPQWIYLDCDRYYFNNTILKAFNYKYGKA